MYRGQKDIFRKRTVDISKINLNGFTLVTETKLSININ